MVIWPALQLIYRAVVAGRLNVNRILRQIRSMIDCASQVGVARVLACPPLSEEEAFPVLAPNYLGGSSNKFRFSLTQQQVREQSSASCGQASYGPHNVAAVLL